MRTISICVVAIGAIVISSGAGAQYRGNGYGSGNNSGGIGGSINLGTGSNSNSNQVDGDTRNNGLRNPVKPAVFVPYTLRMPMYTQILVRTRIPALSILRDVRRQIRHA